LRDADSTRESRNVLDGREQPARTCHQGGLSDRDGRDAIHGRPVKI